MSDPARTSWPSLLLLPILAAAGCPSGPVGEPEVIAYTTLDQRIDTGSEADALSPRLCVSGTSAYVVWEETREGGRSQVLFAAGRSGGVSWEEPIQLSTNPTGEAIAAKPQIACVGSSIYVVYEDDRDSEIGHRNVYIRYSDDGGRTWAAETQLTGDPDGDWDALEPQVVAFQDPNGIDTRIYVTWYDNRSGAYDVYVQSGVNGYNWLAEEVRVDRDAAGSAYSGHPQIAADGVGGVYIVWEDSRDGSNAVYTNSSIDHGVNWRANDTRLDTGTAAGTSDAFGLTLAVDRERTVPAVYVAWHDDRNGPNDIYLNRSLDAGATWDSEPTRIDNDAAGSANSFYPVVNAVDDRVLVAWHDDRNLGFDVYLRSSDDAGASWLSETRVDSDVAGSAHSLDARISRAGDRVAIGWVDYRTPLELGQQGQPDVYYKLSDDEGYIFPQEESRVDDDPQSTAISDDLQMVLSGPLVYMVWVDYRMGNADLWFRAMPSTLSAD